MEQSSESLNSRKRASRDLDSSDSDEVTAKRACADPSFASPHLSVLEELYELEEEGEGLVLEASIDSSTQEDLVAEMMKSLEKVIEGSGENRGEGEVCISNPCAVGSPEASPALDFTWSNEDIEEFQQSPRKAGGNGELYKEDFKDDVQLRQLLQASDDVLGIPQSASSSDMDESAFHEEWASLANESSEPANFFWFDASFHPFEDAPVGLSKEIFEPLVLFLSLAERQASS